MSELNNPFAGLIGVPGVGTSQDPEYGQLQINVKTAALNEEIRTINGIVENVFHFTINPNAVGEHSDRQFIFLEELAQAMNPRLHIDLEALEQALFERLLLSDTEKNIIPRSVKAYKEHVIQKQVFPYLFSSMQNIQSYDQYNSNTVKNALDKMKELIFRNAVTALKQPALFENQDFSVQLVELLQHVDPQSHTFFLDLVKAFVSEGEC